MKSARLSGEDALVARIARFVGVKDPRLVAGIGDDCAAVRTSAGARLLLLKTDCVVERRHFRASDDPRAVGWKAACRAVSDIASCGGEPRWAVVTCVLRPAHGGRWVDDFYRGMQKAAKRFGFSVVGGELASTDGPAVLSVAMAGEVAPRDFVTRGGGKPGDVLFVSGALGGSLESGWHLRFVPRLEQARWLVRHFRVRAMMDLSDGLAADLPRLACASGTGFRVDPGLVPRRRGASLRRALGEGEDFELLFAVAPNVASRLATAWRRKFPRLRLTRIGELAPRGVAEGLGHARGFDHFNR
ncbi:MAG: thiamine-phosphate kinase [Chthoniobacterales bacterium]|nr:thiamine-phosphate kinase [Chthoniobacterales bacterium]